MKFTVVLSVVFAALLSLDSRAEEVSFDNNILYGYRAFLIKQPFEKVVGLQDIGTFYVVSRNLQLRSLDLSTKEFSPLQLEQDTLITILNKSADQVHIGTILDGQFMQYFVHESQLWKSRLVKIGSSLALVDELNGQPVIAPMTIHFSELHENQKRTKGKKIILRCYARVKKFLLRHQLVSDYLPGGSAKLAKKHLVQHGFQQVIGPRSAPVGSVCVYKGGWHGHGHIEVKRGARCWWYGYGCKSEPVKSRQLIGCYHKGWSAHNFAVN